MIPLNNLSSRTKYEKNDFLNLTSPLKETTMENITSLPIKRENAIKFLGIIIDENLITWKNHILTI